MNDKLQQKIREAEDEHAAEVVDAHLEIHRQGDRDRAMYVLGGVNIADRVSASLQSESIKALITFQEQRLYTALGFEDFVSFLGDSEYSPMTKQQFYDRKALLEKEGEAMFNLLTELGLSMRKRKLLGKGNVELEGDVLIVHNGDEVTEISIHDRSTILEAISSLADANAEKSIKIDRLKEKEAKHDDKVRELYSEIDTVKAAKIAETASNPHMVARVELGIAFRRLAEAAAALSAIEKEQFRDGVLEDVAAWRFDLTAAYATDKVTEPGPVQVKGDDFGSALDNFLDNDVELADAL